MMTNKMAIIIWSQREVNPVVPKADSPGRISIEASPTMSFWGRTCPADNYCLNRPDGQYGEG